MPGFLCRPGIIEAAGSKITKSSSILAKPYSEFVRTRKKSGHGVYHTQTNIWHTASQSLPLQGLFVNASDKKQMT